MNKMIAVTIRPGATTAAARLICPLACRSPPPAAASTSAKVPSSSENSRRHSRLGSSKSARSPNSSMSRLWVRADADPSVPGSICWAAGALTASVPCAAACLPGPSARLTGTLSAMPRSLPSSAPKMLGNEERKPAPRSSPARTGTGPAPAVLALPRDVSSQAQSRSSSRGPYRCSRCARQARD